MCYKYVVYIIHLCVFIRFMCFINVMANKVTCLILYPIRLEYTVYHCYTASLNSATLTYHRQNTPNSCNLYLNVSLDILSSWLMAKL